MFYVNMNNIIVIVLVFLLLIYLYIIINNQKKRIKYHKAGKKWDDIVEELSKRK